MKKIMLVAASLVLLVYGAGTLLLSAGAARKFLDEMDALSLRGDMTAFCSRLHDDLAVRVDDRTSPDFPRAVTGGKREYCDFVTFATKGLDLIGLESTVVRDDFRLEHDWLRPWIARVSYHERRTSTVTRGVPATIHTVSDDRWELVLTFSGIKARRLESRSTLAP
jgi:hypothetical protein